MSYASIESMKDTSPSGAVGTEGIPTRGLPPSGGGRLAVLLGRALRRRCPYCGTPGIFHGWFELRGALLVRGDRCHTGWFSAVNQTE